ncbi:hypothetical protein [Xylanibacter oryzae]|uniref:hypothetical protein n=1 Tax=Xylanibacter oryzae TaxID=185293 RepID=UPI0004AE50E0|nr:hypothetical protein [Xylanibacter oryzae]
MLKPDKYMNLDMSVINVGGLIIKSLLSCPVQKYVEVENYVLTALGNAVKPVIIYALDFLYMLGKILYITNSDIIKLVRS